MLLTARVPIVTVQDPILGAVRTCDLPEGTHWGSSGSELETESGGAERVVHIYDPSDAVLAALADSKFEASTLVTGREWRTMRDARKRGDKGARKEELGAYRAVAKEVGERERKARRRRSLGRSAGRLALLIAMYGGAAVAARYGLLPDDIAWCATVGAHAFSEANGTEVNGLALDTGGNWVVPGGDGVVDVDGNAMRRVSGGGGHTSAYDDGMTATDAMTTTGTLNNTNTTQGVMVRRNTSTDTHYMFWSSGGILFRVSAADSGFSNIGSLGGTFSIGSTMALDVDASDTFEGFAGGVSSGTVSDSTSGYETGVGGLRIFSTSGMTTYLCETPGAAPATAVPNSLMMMGVGT